MSAFAVIYERSNSPVEPMALDGAMGRLEHRGPDGRDDFLDKRICMGHWHFWTTPEEEGEQQPVQLAGLPFRMVFDGRLDNRTELLNKLDVSLPRGKNMSDAALVLEAYAHWGKDCFERLVGEFALVILDEQKDELVCARDALGDRTLFYAERGTSIVIASEPWAVAGGSNQDIELNENAAAHFFAIKIPEDGQTIFREIYELLPAHIMICNWAGIKKERYWQPEPSRQIRGLSDEEFGEVFLELLDISVRSRMRSLYPIGVQMSGGLDSTSIACLAARAKSPDPLSTVSFVFDELSDCDERNYIQAVQEQYGINSIQILCDDAWPYKDWEKTPEVNRNHPGGSVYYSVRDRVYRKAQDEGLRILLTGSGGDNLYSAGREWLADFLLERKFREAASGLLRQINEIGFLEALSTGHQYLALRRWLDVKIPALNGFVSQRQSPPWLSSTSVEYLAKTRHTRSPFFERHAVLLGLWPAFGSSREAFYAGRYGLELRHPYRDRRLVEFVLSLPAYQLYYGGYYKQILRTSMRGLLPEVIRNRPRPTYLNSLYGRGLERESKFLHTALQNPNAGWRKFIKNKWISKNRDAFIPNARNKNNTEVLIPWLCISYDAWYQTVFVSE
ncbi:MAG: hypothetical protein JXA13_06420 [Anaerolineales bacterium]|nr:hypothetical protein [Anaerolineales bacterium]